MQLIRRPSLLVISSDIDFTTASTSYVAVTNSDVGPVVVRSRRVLISLTMNTSSASGVGRLQISGTTSAAESAMDSNLKLQRDTSGAFGAPTDIANCYLRARGLSATLASSSTPVLTVPPSFQVLDNPGPGTWYYRLMALVTNANLSFSLRFVNMYAQEMW